MPLISDINETRVFEPDECLDLANQLIRDNSDEAIWENAWILKALANNRDFVIQKYHDRLKSYWSGNNSDKFQPQSLELAHNNRFFIRSNIWLPLDTSSKTVEFEKYLFAYEIAHDHNFQLLTVGYYGPGYPTDIYEYDSNKISGYIGEYVDLSEKTETILIPGRTIFYRKSKDVHIQYLPSEISLSVNLTVSGKNADLLPHYCFDTEKNIITGGAGDLHSNRLFILDVFRTLNDSNTIEILSDFVRHFDCPRTRVVAFQVLDEIEPDACVPLLATTDIGTIPYLKEFLARGNAARGYSRF